jgi:hypothetical protein
MQNMAHPGRLLQSADCQPDSPATLRGENSMKSARILIATILLLAAVSVYVQADDRPLLTATVPFAFTVQNIDLPAGTYTISVLPPYNMIRVQSATGKSVALTNALASPSRPSKQAKLVFHRIGGHNFLTQVWEQGSQVHRDVPSGQLARELAGKGGKIQSTTILASASRRSQ